MRVFWGLIVSVGIGGAAMAQSSEPLALRDARRQRDARVWRVAGPVRSEPRDLSAHESEAADRFRVDDRGVPAVAGKQGALADRADFWTVGRAARPAGGERQGSRRCARRPCIPRGASIPRLGAASAIGRARQPRSSVPEWRPRGSGRSVSRTSPPLKQEITVRRPRLVGSWLSAWLPEPVRR